MATNRIRNDGPLEYTEILNSAKFFHFLFTRHPMRNLRTNNCLEDKHSETNHLQESNYKGLIAILVENNVKGRNMPQRRMVRQRVEDVVGDRSNALSRQINYDQSGLMCTVGDVISRVFYGRVQSLNSQHYNYLVRQLTVKALVKGKSEEASHRVLPLPLLNFRERKFISGRHF